MPRKRKYISMEERLAAALLTILHPDDTGALVPVIPYERAKGMTAKQIIAEFQFDHGIFHAHGGPDKAWNLTPRPKAAHRRKTAKIDQPAIAKVKRLSVAQKEFRRTVLKPSKAMKRKRPASRWPKRPFPTKAAP
jgi:hypothetical protein